MSAVREIIADPSMAYYYAQKGLRSASLRHAAGASVAAVVGQRSSIDAGPLAQDIATRLRADGFATLPQKTMGAEVLARVRAQLDACPLYDYYGSGQQYSLAEGIPPDVIKIRHDNANVIACRPLMDLANDPDILAAVTQRLGATPTIAAAEAWWTFGEHNRDSRSAFDDIYHRDVDDLRFVKLFLYLTDTQLDSGAHRFVLGSHADARFTRRGPISDGEVESAYPRDRLLTVTGAAGTAFLEETWGIHRALLATQGRRLVFSVIYVLAAKVPFGPRKPLLPLPEGYDRYVNRRLYY